MKEAKSEKAKTRYLRKLGGSRNVMVNELDYRIVLSEFELQLHFNVHFRTNTLGKDMNPLILLDMG